MDSSAAAVASLALLKLAEARPDTNCGKRYLCAAINTLRTLADSQYLAKPSDDGGAVLLHATANRPQVRLCMRMCFDVVFQCCQVFCTIKSQWSMMMRMNSIKHTLKQITITNQL